MVVLECFARGESGRYHRAMVRRYFTVCITCAAIWTGGCGEEWLNQTASFGGNTAGGRGSLGVVILNNTPYQAVLTLGSYDQAAEVEPDFRQYTLDGSLQLDADADGGVLSLDCARVVSIGGLRLLSQIEESGADFSSEALIEGIEFFSTSGDESEEPVSQGVVGPFEVLLGVDFPCNSLLIFKLEVDDAGTEPFRIDFELIPSESSR